ncbi:MAG TPA: FHA domain-containing protein [Myxococcaceae bacterium]|nr:FHA domain-containing protein [Myxococcaceae bacterium]
MSKAPAPAPKAASPAPAKAPAPGPAKPATPRAEPAPKVPARAPASASAPAAAPKAATAPARAGAAPSKFGLTVLEGFNAGQRFRLAGAGCMVGRNKGAILFSEDVFVSPHHGTFLLRDGRLFIRDEASVSGIYVSILGGEAIQAGDYFAAGHHLFRFAGALPSAPAATPDRPAIYGAPMRSGQPLYAFEEIVVAGRVLRVLVTAGPLLTIGQEQCDLSYPGDETLAARHCEISPNGPGATLRDVSGGMGTFVRVPAGIERPLSAGDRVRIGQQVIQVDVAA